MHKILLIFASWGALTGALAAGPLRAADRVELIHGGQLDGAVRQVEEAKRPFSLVELPEGIRVAIPQGQVRRTVDSETLAEYRKFAAAAGDDPERHFLLAKWCTKQQLEPQRDYHMERVIALAPDHEQARAALGFVRRRGDWIPYAEQQRDRGMVLSAGRWQLPEAVAIDEQREETEVTVKGWKKEVARLRRQALRGGDQGAEALQALRGLQDEPFAAVAIGEELIQNRKSQPQSLRLMWVALLGAIRTQAAVEPLIQIGLNEPDPVVRERAYEKLESYGKQAAIYSYLPLLKSANHAEVKAAGRALIELHTPEIKLALVDALVPTHTTTGAPPPGMSLGFGQGGGGGLSMGGKPKQETRHLRNPQVLAALKAIVPDVDYQYDEQAWRRYFAAEMTRYAGNLRRDR
jgi:hypothetical protein